MAKPDAPWARGDRTLYDTTLGWRFPNPRLEESFPLESMGETGENVAERWQVSREDQDAFALASQQRWARRSEAGRFADELIPVGEVERDEHPRPETSAEKLATLKPAFRQGGTRDGRQLERRQRRRRRARDRLRGAGARARRRAARRLRRQRGRGRRPAGDGDRPGSRRPQAACSSAAGSTADDLDLVELNEAFASQSVAVIRELGLDPAKVNVNGGAIALGHPLGMSGARLVVSLLHELRRRGGRYGLATLCVGVGQGQAALFERAGA